MRDIVACHAPAICAGLGQNQRGVLICPVFFRREPSVSSRPAFSQSPAIRPRVATFRGWLSSIVAGALLQGLAIDAFAQSPTSSPPASQAESVSEPWRTDRFYFETSLYTRHFSNDPAHVDKQKLILGEWNITEQWLVGASFFDNSFGQPTQYVYGGWRYRPFEQLQPFYVKVSAGPHCTATRTSIATRSRSIIRASRRSSFHRSVTVFRGSAPSSSFWRGRHVGDARRDHSLRQFS